jgi:phosphatidyl-myo-inositol dimannoside synthase
MYLPALFGFFPNIQPNRFGGVEASGRLAWQALQEAVHARAETATLFCYEWDGTVQEQGGFERIVARTKAQAIWQALRVQAKPRTILVWHLAMLKLVPFLRAPHARVVVFLHGIEAWRAQDKLTQRVLPRVNLFLSNSQFTYERFLQFQPGVRNIAHRVVPLGLDAPDPIVAAPANPPGALMVSRLERGEDYKGHRELIGVWQRVRATIPDAKLWIAGEGTLRADLEALTREHNVSASVKFFGRISETKKQELLRDCRLFAMPSWGEGFGLVYLEAMRVGRPCLVSDCDAGVQVVNPPEAGLAVNPADADALVEALTRLLHNDAQWNQWSQAARRRYETNFTAEQFQTRIVSAVLN